MHTGSIRGIDEGYDETAICMEGDIYENDDEGIYGERKVWLSILLF